MQIRDALRRVVVYIQPPAFPVLIYPLCCFPCIPMQTRFLLFADPPICKTERSLAGSPNAFPTRRRSRGAAGALRELVARLSARRWGRPPCPRQRLVGRNLEHAILLLEWGGRLASSRYRDSMDARCVAAWGPVMGAVPGSSSSVRPSVRPCVRPCVRPSVRPLNLY